MAKLLILGPFYRRNIVRGFIPAIERYDGLFYRIVRKNMNKVREKGIDIIMITEDLEVVAPETKLSCKSSIGNRWRTLLPIARGSGKIEKLRSQILTIVKIKRYDEIFIGLNKHYQVLLELVSYTKKVIVKSRGLSSKSKMLKMTSGVICWASRKR